MRFIPLTLETANLFIESHHRHNKPVVGGKYSLGLMKDGQLIGVAVAGRPIARLMDNGKNLEILRVCVLEGYPGACSKLYGRMKAIGQLFGYEKIFTYTLPSESGSSLKAIGAVVVATVQPQEWNRAGRHRESQRIFKQEKLRWELT